MNKFLNILQGCVAVACIVLIGIVIKTSLTDNSKGFFKNPVVLIKEKLDPLLLTQMHAMRDFI